MQIFLKYIHDACMCIYIYKIIIHTTHILCKLKLLFWMQLIVYIYIYICMCVALIDLHNFETYVKYWL